MLYPVLVSPHGNWTSAGPASKAASTIAQYTLPASPSLTARQGKATRLFRLFTLACQVLPALRSQHNELRCPPSTHGSGHRERMTTKASKSPRIPGKSSGCRHQEPHAHRNSSTAYNHLFACFRSFPSTPELPPHDPDPPPPRQPQVQIRRPLTSLAECDRLADRRDLRYAPVNAYTWQRGRPTELIHPRDRRCPGTLRRDRR
jgi:hypothetical protein